MIILALLKAREFTVSYMWSQCTFSEGWSDPVGGGDGYLTSVVSSQFSDVIIVQCSKKMVHVVILFCVCLCKLAGK